MTPTVFQPPRVVISHDAWQASGSQLDRRAVLHATIDINECSMHVTAIAVTTVGGVQRAVSEDMDATLDLFSDVTGAGDPWETLDIDGRDYVLLIAPFAR